MAHSRMAQLRWLRFTFVIIAVLLAGSVPARELQTLNPRLRVEQIAGAGHGLQYDQPERFEAVVRSFLRLVGAA